MTDQPPAARAYRPTDLRTQPDAVAAHIAPAVAELTQIVLGTQPLGSVMHRIAGLAHQTVPGADEVSVTVIDHDQFTTVWSAGNLAAVLDERQYTSSGRGPCLDAAGTGHTITIADTADDRRYPEFSRRAYDYGIRHVVAVAMPGPQHARAALGIYGFGHAGPFTPEALDVAARFAEPAAIVVANAALHAGALDEIAQMKTAMASRAVIEQAKGMTMRDHRCNAAEAFAHLVDLSTQTNRTVHEIAEFLIDTASPGPSDGGPPKASAADLQSAAMDLVDGFDDRDMDALAQLTPADRAEQRRARTTLFTYTEQLWAEAKAEDLQLGPRPGFYAVSALRNLMDALCGHIDEAQQAAGDAVHDD